MALKNLKSYALFESENNTSFEEEFDKLVQYGLNVEKQSPDNSWWKDFNRLIKGKKYEDFEQWLKAEKPTVTYAKSYNINNKWDELMSDEKYANNNLNFRKAVNLWIDTESASMDRLKNASSYGRW